MMRSLLALCLLSLSSTLAAAVVIPQPPSVDAKAWILMDYASGQILAEQQADEPLPPASLTKLMTAYIVEQQIDQGNISEDDQVPVSVKAWRTGGSRMFIQEGTQVLLSDLMKGLVVQSGNDAAVALAEYVAGGTDAFADIMNTVARSLGMSQSYFENPTGLPGQTVSTSRDLAVLAWHIIHDYPQHYRLYKEKSFTYNNITQPNRVLLLWRDNRVDGLKTGHTEEAGYCQVVSAVDANGMRLIAVVMGTKSEEARAVESQKLLNYGFRFFRNHTAYKADTTLATPRLWLGKQNQVELGLTEDLTITIPQGAGNNLEVVTNINPDLKAPIAKGDKLGSVSIMLNGDTVKSADLVALHEVERAGFFARLWDHVLMFFSSFFS